MTKVSVIIPNFNHCDYLHQRIDSVLNQTYQDFEVILLDDVSKDQSVRILETYRDHPKIAHIVINKNNSGSPFGMWQKGFDLSKGDLIWIAESDDWADARFLETLVPKFENNDVVVAHCISNNYYMKTKVTKINSWWTTFNVNLWDSDFVENGKRMLSNYGKYKCPVINVSSALIRKRVLKTIEIPIQYKYCGDWWFWVQVFDQGDVAYTAKALNFIRVHDASASSSKNSKTILKIKENIKVIQNASNILGQDVSYHANYKWLIDFWVKQTVNSKDYLKREYLFPKVPISFLIVYYKQLIYTLFNKAFSQK
ncbi:glycosyltransferase family 2 protein [Winogradskyella schleiferi]|uniref:glycosyltransferase family 2 protein n=1 Tax=Winogradskyella schleiferi TaxID=2686078 RepID=UPI0015BC2FDD|nr:glycosyltransferase family 2 protein [Winogradskyella schleiferi]